MKNKSYMLSLVLLFILLTVFSTSAFSQTERFNVKTQIEKIADSSTEFLNQIISQSKKEPKKQYLKILLAAPNAY